MHRLCLDDVVCMRVWYRPVRAHKHERTSIGMDPVRWPASEYLPNGFSCMCT